MGQGRTVFVFVGRIFDTEPATIITHNLVPVHAGGWRALVDLGSRTLPRLIVGVVTCNGVFID